MIIHTMKEILMKINIMEKEIFFKDGRNYYGDWEKNPMNGKGIFTLEK